jgi:hypothetical protein
MLGVEAVLLGWRDERSAVVCLEEMALGMLLGRDWCVDAEMGRFWGFCDLVDLRRR